MSRVLICASGFIHPDWDENYYPSDIPEEWKLAYYANDFTAVVLPEAIWRNTKPELLEEWLEDIDDAFRVYLRVTTQMPDKNSVDFVISLFERHFAGFFVDDSLEVNQDQLLAGVDWLVAGHLALDSAGSWGRLGEIEFKTNAVVIDKYKDKRELKQAFEGIVPFLDAESDVLVLYDVVAPVAQDLKDLRILLELMGIA